MKTKRYLLLCCLCVLMLLCLSGCGCRHSYDGWKADQTMHWHVCDKCGEELHQEEHNLAMGNQCEICEFYFYPEDEGMVVESYDERDAKSYTATYGQDGELQAYQRFELSYFDDGQPSSMKAFGYENLLDEEGTERPLWENHFLPYENGEEGEVYLHLDIMYEMDGTKITREYNQAGELVKEERS